MDSLSLWEKFTEEQPDEEKFQILYTKHSIHLNKLMKNNIYLLIVLRISLDNILYKTYKTLESENIPYINNSYFLGKNLQIKEFALQKFLDHFCQQFRLFYSSFDSIVEDDSVTESNKMLLKSFIRNYSKLYAEDSNKINIMRYFYKMIIYAPVNKTQFMALNYLTKIIRTLDTQILDYMIFYRGYFIYSTMNHKISQLFFDYLYRGQHSMKQQ